MDRTPAQPLDESGACRHLYLTPDDRCVHCGMEFRLAWRLGRGALLGPTLRNLAIAILGAAVVAAGATAGAQLIAIVFLVLTVLLFTRALLGGLDVLVRHGFSPGRLGPLRRRAWHNLLVMKPYVAYVGYVRFPMDRETYDLFDLGDSLLVEHLRWSRLPVAIYLGRLE